VNSAVAKIALALLAVAGVVAFLENSSPADVATATAQPTRAATPAPTSSPRATAKSTAFTITVSDADLTQSAAAGFPQTVNGVTVSDPQVSIDSDRVRLVARAKVLFGTTDFVMTATPTVSNGHLDVQINSATLAGFSVPSDTRASIQQTVQATLATYVPASVNVTSVTLAPGTLTVQGTQR
jgi:uncharacterized protein YpmS